MSVLEILHIPNPKLKRVSEPVTEVDGSVRRILDDMMDTMYDANGIGLAAPQIGIAKRLVVIDVSHDIEDDDGNVMRGRNPQYFINPEIIESSSDAEPYDEGCLSVPGEYAEVCRPSEVTVKYIDRSGREQVEHMTGLLARCIQHEIDHLNGVVFIDRISKMKRDIIVRRAKRKEYERTHYDD